MKLKQFLKDDFQQLIEWIDNEELNYQWGGPAYQYPLSFAQIEEHCSNPLVHPYIFTVQHRQVGFVELHQSTPTTCRICRVFISPKYRRQNYATKMLELLMQKAQKELTCKIFTLGVFSHNQIAISTYTNLGFKIIDIEKNTRSFHEQNFELIKMEKRLNP